MQNPRNLHMDPEFQAQREAICKLIESKHVQVLCWNQDFRCMGHVHVGFYCYNLLERRNTLTPQWLNRLPELAKRLEEYIYKGAVTKENYLKVVMGPVEHLLQPIYRTIQNHSQPLTHHLTPSSSFGLISNGYQPTSCINLASSVLALPQELSQMIPTAMFNNIETLCVDSEDSNGVGFSNINSIVTSHMQQQKQYDGSQNGNFLKFGGHIGAGIQSNMQQSPVACGFSNGCMNGGLGLLGGNNQILNDSAAYNCSPKSLQQHFGQPHHQSLIGTSLPQQVLPVLDDNYALKPADVASSASRYGPSSPVLSSSNNPNTSTTNMYSQPRTNPTVLNQQENMKELQPLTRSQVFHPQKMS